MLKTWYKFLRIKLEHSRGSSSFILSYPYFIAKRNPEESDARRSLFMLCIHVL